jgi:hypothetical protein
MHFKLLVAIVLGIATGATGAYAYKSAASCVIKNFELEEGLLK